MPAQAPPNILLFVLDQQRYDCLAPARLVKVHTPNIDRLAKQGCWFERAYTPIPTCCPARQSLLSGQWAERHGGLWNFDIALPVRLFEAPTWSQQLASAGYRCGYVGKWHVHPNKSPLEFGYQEFVSVADYADWRRTQNLPDPVTATGAWLGGHDPVPTSYSRTHWHAQQSIELIERFANTGTPWHVRLDFEEPHLPCYPTARFAALYDPAHIAPWANFGDEFANKPYIQKQMKRTWGIDTMTWDDWAPVVARYLAMVSQVDDAVGTVLDAVERLGLANDTLIIFTADHGDACGSHGLIDKHYVMYEEQLRVPLVLKWPGHVPPGTRCDAFVIHGLDGAATISDAAACPPLADVQGHSLLPLAAGRRPANWRRFAYSSYNGQQFGLYCQRMIRDQRWKYIWNPTDLDELYDLEADPAELHNRIGDRECSAIIRHLQTNLLAHLDEVADGLVASEFVRPQLASGAKYTSR